MAKKYDNYKGFLVIEMSYTEAANICGFGIDVGKSKIIVCDTCNEVFPEEDNIYYVAAINRALCKECCDDFINNIDRYDEGIPYEKSHYNHYAKKLKLEEV